MTPRGILVTGGRWKDPVTLLLVGGGYLVLATAAFVPSDRVSYLFVASNLAWLVLLLAVNERVTGNLMRCWLLLLPLMLCYLPAAQAATDSAFLIKKFEGAVLATLLASALLYTSLKRIGAEQVQRAWIAVGSVFLIATLAYKLQFGFNDRQVRFFVNGPIVFGWLMGLASVTSLQVAMRSDRMAAFFGISGIFALAVLWSASKGPVISLALAASLLLISNGAKRAFLATGLALGVVTILLALAPENALDRFSGVEQLLFRPSAHSDGSIEPRRIAWQQAIAMFRIFPFTGGGLGNFQYFTTLSLDYPHNLFLESAAEAGLVGLTGLVLTLAVLFKVTTGAGRIWLVFTMAAVQFSGDVSYLRIVMAMPLALAAHKFWEQQQRFRSSL